MCAPALILYRIAYEVLHENTGNVPLTIDGKLDSQSRQERPNKRRAEDAVKHREVHVMEVGAVKHQGGKRERDEYGTTVKVRLLDPPQEGSLYSSDLRRSGPVSEVVQGRMHFHLFSI